MPEQLEEDFELLEPYGTLDENIIRIHNPEQFIQITNNIPQHFVVYRKSYFHHYLFKSYNYHNGIYTIEIIHKYGKSGSKSLSRALLADTYATIKHDKIQIKYNSGEYFVQKDSNRLLDFAKGVFLIDIYNDETKIESVHKASKVLGKSQIYSAESSNCEHFVTWLLTGTPISYQIDFKQWKASVADGLTSAASSAVKGGLTQTGFRTSIALATKVPLQVSKNIAPKVASLATAPLKAGAIGVGIAAPFEIGTLAYKCHKMAKQVEKGEMKKSDMKREVTKNFFGSAGSLGGSFGGASAGAALGAAIGTVVPVVGNITGGVIGGIVGGLVGSFSGKWAGTQVGNAVYNVADEVLQTIKSIKSLN